MQWYGNIIIRQRVCLIWSSRGESHIYKPLEDQTEQSDTKCSLKDGPHLDLHSNKSPNTAQISLLIMKKRHLLSLESHLRHASQCSGKPFWTYRTYSLKTYVRTWTKGDQCVRSPHCGLSWEIGKYETLFLDMWSIGVKNLLAIPGLWKCLLLNHFPVCCSIGMVEREEGGAVAFRPVSPSWPCRGAAAYSTIALAYFLHKLHNNI